MLEISSKIKEFDKIEYDDFFTYFEQTWLSLISPNNSLYNFSLWSYFDKFEFEGNKKRLISMDFLEENFFFRIIV